MTNKTAQDSLIKRRLAGEEICIFCGEEHCVEDYGDNYFVAAEENMAVWCRRCNKEWCEIHKVTAILPYNKEEDND